MATQSIAAAAPAPANPLLAPWPGEYGGLPPFDTARPEMFGPAFTQALAERQAEMDAIANDPKPATFANVIEPMQRSGQTLQRIYAIYGVETSNMNTPAYQKIDREWSPKFAAAQDRITLDPKLFARIAAVYDKRAGLNPMQQRLVTRTYDSYVRQGAKLDAAGKAKLSQLNQQLASLFSDFSSKLLADEGKAIFFASADDLAGLPASTIAGAKAAATSRGQADKWAIVNTRSAVDPFLTFATNRANREKVWRAFVSRGDNGDANDTNAIITQIVKLRADRAHLLGYPTHAAWRMQDTMAKTPQAAMDLMMRVWTPAVKRVHEEVADQQAIADKEKTKITIEPWDYRFYQEKVRKARYDIDQSELKPYFELDNMIQGAFYAAGRLYGFTFKEVTPKVPVFEKSVRVWEVSRAGKVIGLFYGDYFARDIKRSGAWATGYKSRSRFLKTEYTLSSNNNNFAPVAEGEKVLISVDDAQTLFHEFGHAIHGLASDVAYPGLGGTPRDFVEYPSQVNEYWSLNRDVLDRYAKHYQTGAPMPAALVDKVIASQKFNQGFATVEYLACAILDMDLHTIPDGAFDPKAFEKAELARIGMPKEIAMRHRLPQFNHLFSSDSYSAGYYSYLWSDTMVADTIAAFTEGKGPWDKAVADRFYSVLLATGNETDRAEAYRAFRGRDPDVRALLEKRGFPEK
ncbi:M3 family metallopeptidase [Sphingomonas naphthae]|uniref:M3 family metallopeptidase n=1 Tax=Sphingomonas naphthae TaxID=1813468 RepID=A0ABY7TSK6_9SPHN|nr:M3 family metallopeptidase [Sphingomonas naphthae]WCT75385.1 M3 family metallopeptidase [Sphingomonas naphthae]